MTDELESAPSVSVDLLTGLLQVDPKNGEYTFVDRASEAIAALLDVVFTLPEPEKELDQLIKLSSALEFELRSPGAAALLRAVMCCDERFLSLLGVGKEWRGFDANPEVALLCGARDVRRAPMHGATIPGGTVKAGSLVEVVPPHIAKRERRRARAG